MKTFSPRAGLERWEQKSPTGSRSSSSNSREPSSSGAASSSSTRQSTTVRVENYTYRKEGTSNLSRVTQSGTGFNERFFLHADAESLAMA